MVLRDKMLSSVAPTTVDEGLVGLDHATAVEKGLVGGLDLASRLAADQPVPTVVLLLAAPAGHRPQETTNGERGKEGERVRGQADGRLPKR